jgi:hypothetical protein
LAADVKQQSGPCEVSRSCCQQRSARKQAQAVPRPCCCGLSTTRCLCREQKSPPSLPASPAQQRPANDLTFAALGLTGFQAVGMRVAAPAASVDSDGPVLSAHERCALLAVWLN